jgi:nitroimidazol reductase NimA-like FMN-containing flavoprotein (pyridoxamine 5'-phosphate oxidase superfamily)
MTKEEREAFLTGVHIGIVSIPQDGRGPLTVPLWYRYQPGGDVEFETGRGSRKGRLLEVGRRISLCVQTEKPPYKYVSVEGPVTAMEPAQMERDTRPLAHRYLGAAMGEKYLAATDTEEMRQGAILVRLRPEHWLAFDFSKTLSL